MVEPVDDVTTLNYNMMISLLCCVSIEVRDLRTYDGLSEVDTFLYKFEREVLGKQSFQALNWVLRPTPARWWDMHKGSFEGRNKCKRMTRTRFGKPRVRLDDKYNGEDGLHLHLSRWVHAYGKQLFWLQINFALGDTINKNVFGGGGGGECTNGYLSWNNIMWREQSCRRLSTRKNLKRCMKH